MKDTQTKTDSQGLRHFDFYNRQKWIVLVLALPKNKLSDTDKNVATRIGLSVNRHLHYAFASHAEIAAKIGKKDTRIVRRAIEKMEKLNLLQVSNRGGGIYVRGDGRREGKRCHYHLIAPANLPLANEEEQENETRTPESGYENETRTPESTYEQEPGLKLSDSRTQTAHTRTQMHEPGLGSPTNSNNRDSNNTNRNRERNRALRACDFSLEEDTPDFAGAPNQECPDISGDVLAALYADATSAPDLVPDPQPVTVANGVQDKTEPADTTANGGKAEPPVFTGKVFTVSAVQFRSFQQIYPELKLFDCIEAADHFYSNNPLPEPDRVRVLFQWLDARQRTHESYKDIMEAARSAKARRETFSEAAKVYQPVEAPRPTPASASDKLPWRCPECGSADSSCGCECIPF